PRLFPSPGRLEARRAGERPGRTQPLFARDEAMSRKINARVALVGASLASLVLFVGLRAEDPKTAKSDPPKSEAPMPTWATTAVKPKPLSDTVKKGLAWLVSQQKEDGGWGQGGGWRAAPNGGGGRVEGTQVKDPTDVGNTC